jgi:hypothetical protein
LLNSDSRFSDTAGRDCAFATLDFGRLESDHFRDLLQGPLDAQLNGQVMAA